MGEETARSVESHSGSGMVLDFLRGAVGLEVRWPRVGMSSSNVEGTFWCEVSGVVVSGWGDENPPGRLRGWRQRRSRT